MKPKDLQHLTGGPLHPFIHPYIPHIAAKMADAAREGRTRNAPINLPCGTELELCRWTRLGWGYKVALPSSAKGEWYTYLGRWSAALVVAIDVTEHLS